MNRYMAYYRRETAEVEADTSYQAQQKAAAIFHAKHSYEVDVMLAEKGGEPVIHSTAEVGS